MWLGQGGWRGDVVQMGWQEAAVVTSSDLPFRVMDLGVMVPGSLFLVRLVLGTLVTLP